MGQKPICTMACRSSALSLPYTGNSNSPRHERFWNKDGSGDRGSPGNRSWQSSSPDRNEDYVSSPTLTHCHQVLEAIESLRRQTGLSEDGVRSPPPPPLILYASEDPPHGYSPNRG